MSFPAAAAATGDENRQTQPPASVGADKSEGAATSPSLAAAGDSGDASRGSGGSSGNWKPMEILAHAKAVLAVKGSRR